MKSKTRIVQVSNIAPQATKDQLSSLFSYLGKIEDIRLFPTIRDVAIPVQSRICFIKFSERDTVGVAQHLTNVVFIDRALLVIPYLPGELPDETRAIELLNSTSVFPNLTQKLPWSDDVKNEVDGIVLKTKDPRLIELGLPEYPNLPATTENHKVNEIRRTLVFDNLPPSTTEDQLEEFANEAGIVKYLRLGTDDDKSGVINALVEYADQKDIADAMNLHGKLLNGSPVIVNHSTVAIVKPQTKSNDSAVREIEEAMQRVKQAQTILNANVDPLTMIDGSGKDKSSRSTSRSRSRHRTRSPSRRRSRSRSRERRRRRSRSKSRSRRSGSKTRSKRRSRSRSKSRRKSRSKSRSRKRSRSRSRKRSRSKSPRSSKSSRRDKDRRRSSKDKDRERKERDEKRDKDKKKDHQKEEQFEEGGKKVVEESENGTDVKVVESHQVAAAVAEGSVVNDASEVTEITVEGEEVKKENEGEAEANKEADNAPEKEKDAKDYEEEHENKKVEEKKSRDKKSSRRSRSSSPRRRRSRSGSRSKKSKRHRSRSRDRKRSRTPKTRRRSSSPRRRDKRSRTRDRSRDRKDRDRRDRDRRERRDRDSRDRRDRDSRDRKDRRDRKRDRKEKEDRKEDEKEEKKEAVVARDYDEEEIGYEKDEGRKEEKSATSVDMDISP